MLFPELDEAGAVPIHGAAGGCRRGPGVTEVGRRTDVGQDSYCDCH